MLTWFRRKPKIETRAAASGFTAEIMSARESYVSGARGLAELTATVQACVSLWEGAFALADVNHPTLTPRSLALTGRFLAMRGEAVFLIGDDGLVPCADWDLSTRNGEPRAYRVSVSEAGGGRSMTALAPEVLHVRIGADPVAPWSGVPPLRRASLTAGMLHALEDALREVYETAPLGTSIVPFPESSEAERETIGRDFRGRRGRVLLRESVSTTAAGGPVPQSDWRPADVTPDLGKSMALDTFRTARDAVSMAFGVLPAFHAPMATGPVIREAQRHLAQWTLQPIAGLIAEEVSAKFGAPVTIDIMRPLQAYDAGGRARAVAGVVQALATAKAGGVKAAEIEQAFNLVNWEA